MKRNNIIIVLLIILVLQNLYGIYKVEETSDDRYVHTLNDVILNTCEITISTGKEIKGTGVYLGNSFILTCFHLFKNINFEENSVGVMAKFYNDDNEVNCKIFKFDSQHDIMLLKTAAPVERLDEIKIANSKDIYTGMCIFGIGNSLGNGLCVHKGIVGVAYTKIIKNNGEVGVMQTNIAIDNGDSGGPLYDYNGNLVGIMSFRMVDENANASYASSYAVSVCEIRKLLNYNGIII